MGSRVKFAQSLGAERAAGTYKVVVSTRVPVYLTGESLFIDLFFFSDIRLLRLVLRISHGHL
jgi:hypothetical protein